jgi:hypothetical protein
VAIFTVEGDRCLSLVRDAHGGDSVAVFEGAAGHLAQGGDRQVGDLASVVLDPTGVGEMLGEFARGDVKNPGAWVKREGPDARRASVEGEDQLHWGEDSEEFWTVIGPRMSGTRILAKTEK